MPTTIDTLAAWAAELQLEGIPQRVLDKARWQLASVLAASLAGRHDPAGARVLDATRAAGRGETRVLAGGFFAPRAAAVLANASVSCSFDYDEILLLGHPGHSSVTVPLALGEALGLTAGEVLAAQVAANEVDGRRLEAGREIAEGALSLPDGPARAMGKLRSAALTTLGADGAARTCEAPVSALCRTL